jgi:energy-coupling factor transporter ATP-binding protein EcfA2
MSWTTWASAGAALAAVVIIRRPRVAAWVTRTIMGRGASDAADTPRLFVGPRSIQAGELLPGRRADIDSLAAHLRDSRFVVLSGESGCGKSSLMNAVLAEAEEASQAVVLRLTSSAHEELTHTLLELHAGQAEPKAKPILLVLDQFEEFFRHVADAERVRIFETLRRELAKGRTRLALVIRSDHADLLSTLVRHADPQQTTLNLGNYVVLRPFRKDEARLVVNTILGRANPDGEVILKLQHEEFAEALVDQLLRPPRDVRLSRDDEPRVLPVELQIAGLMAEQRGTDALTAQGLNAARGVRGLFADYLEDARRDLMRRTGISYDAATLLLRVFVDPGRRRRAVGGDDLAREVSISHDQASTALKVLIDRYLITPVAASQPDGPLTYQLLHDHLAVLLSEAPDRAMLRARDAQERLRFWVTRWVEREEPGGSLGWWSRVWNRAPMPITEAMSLRHYATSSTEKQILSTTLGAFAARTGVVGAVAALMVGSVAVGARTDAYQQYRVIRDAPFLATDNTLEGDMALGWIRSLVAAGEDERAINATASMINSGSQEFYHTRGEALGVAAIAAANSGDTARLAQLKRDILRYWDNTPTGYVGARNRAVMMLTRALLMAGQASEAENVLVSRVQRDRTAWADFEGLPVTIRTLRDMGREDEAMRLLAQLAHRVKTDPEMTPSQSTAVATAFLDAGDPSTASELARQAARSGSLGVTGPEAIFALAKLLDRLRQRALADSVYGLALEPAYQEVGSDSAVARLRVAAALAEGGRAGAARRELNFALSASGATPAAAANAALVYRTLGDTARSDSLFRVASEKVEGMVHPSFAVDTTDANDPQTRAVTLTRTAEAFTRASRNREAKRILSAAAVAAREMDVLDAGSEEFDERSFTLARIAEAYTLNGQPREARLLANLCNLSDRMVVYAAILDWLNPGYRQRSRGAAELAQFAPMDLPPGP